MSTAYFNGETKFLQEVLNPYKLEHSFVLAFSMLSTKIPSENIQNNDSIKEILLILW